MRYPLAPWLNEEGLIGRRARPDHRRWGSRCLGTHNLVWLFAVLQAVASPGLWAATSDAMEKLRDGGYVLVIRHALAPGIGDPENFHLDDCTTQRNLNDAGRRQARSIGDWLRSKGIERARVYSSQWCRCLETAKLLNLGPVTELPALNSFFRRTQDREPNLAALKDFLARQPSDGEPLVLVTHQVTITALSGEFASSGTGLLTVIGPDGGARTVMRIAFDE